MIQNRNTLDEIFALLDELKSHQRDLIVQASAKGGMPSATWFRRVGQSELAICAIEQLIDECKAGKRAPSESPDSTAPARAALEPQRTQGQPRMHPPAATRRPKPASPLAPAGVLAESLAAQQRKDGTISLP